jgi:signal transduction histidine kinase
MSATHMSSFKLQDQDVLGELLHSLSQPLTSLRCSLELSFDEAAERQQAAVGIALQQTERVIGMIQLMREYLDAEQPGPVVRRASLDRAMRAVVEDLTSVAEVRGVELCLEGNCSATVCLAEPRLRLALQYLALALIEETVTGSKIVLRLEEGSTESALHAGVQGGLTAEMTCARPLPASVSMHRTLRRVRLAIARRILESGGTLLTIEDGCGARFLLRIPRMLAASCAVV